MATFNTAFGALPSVKSLAGQRGRRAPGQRPQAQDGEEYAGNQQMQAQQQAQQQRQQQMAPGGQTFADLQKQGRARPAPMQPGMQPGMQPQPMAPGSLPAQVQDVLGRRPAQAPGMAQPGVVQPSMRRAAPAAPQAMEPEEAPEVMQGEPEGVISPVSVRTSAPTFPATPPSAGGLMGQLQEQLFRLQMGQSDAEQQAFEAKQAAQMADLEAQFGAQRSQLEEELAARGLYASTIGGGRFGDLAGQQARAMATLQAELLGQQANLAAERQKTLISGLQSAAGTQAEIESRAAQLQQEERLKGRELTLQEARDQATREYQTGQLGLGREEIASRERLSGAEIASRERLSGAELSSRERMAQAEQAQRERMQQTQLGFDERMEGKRQELQLKLQSNQLTADEARQLADLNSRRDLANLQIQAEKERQLAQFGFTAEQEKLRRQLEKDLQEGRITADKQRQLDELTFRKDEAERQRQFDEQQRRSSQDFQRTENELERRLRETLAGQTFGLERDRFIMDLIRQIGGNLTPAQQEELRRKYGVGAPTGPGAPPAGPGNPPAGPGGPGSQPGGGAGVREGDRRTNPQTGQEEEYRNGMWTPVSPRLD